MRPNIQEQYLRNGGFLTPEGYKLLDQMGLAIEALQALAAAHAATIAAQAAIIADHEARIVALEP